MTLVAVPRSMAEPEWRPAPDERGAGLRGIEAARAELDRARLAHPAIPGSDRQRSAACTHPDVRMVNGRPVCGRCETVIDRVVLPCDEDPEA